MAAGFRTPLFILGLSAGVAIQAGFNGPLPHRAFSGTTNAPSPDMVSVERESRRATVLYEDRVAIVLYEDRELTVPQI